MSYTFDGYNFEYEWYNTFINSNVCEPQPDAAISLPVDNKGNLIRTYLYTPDVEQKILNHLNCGDISELLAFLDFIYFLKYPFNHFKRYLLYNLINTVTVYISEHSSDEREITSVLSPLFNEDSITGIYKALKKIISDICETNKPKKGSKLCIRVHSYIESHYLDQNLSVNSIADALGLHYVYLSSSFKKYSGLGVSDCINKIRINKSKYLLTDLSKTVEEVALAVGYSTRKTYVRIFRKLEGVTPSKYRELIYKN
ncbi:MAG: helix-turn-helix transcriptional regulator [Clostridia bacterium]|nr:helix-turn-helix transcriptional regulator [Clostridia bacterium]